MSIRICIADDHSVVRKGIIQILSEAKDMKFVAETARATEVLEMVRNHECDILLLDLTMPERHGLEVLKDVKTEFPELPVLILSMHSEEQFGIRVLRERASGYLRKDAPPEEMMTAIRKVAGGGKYISSRLAELLGNEVHHEIPRLPHESLSRQEYAVFIRLSAGRPVGEIARDLFLSVKTVSNYRTRLLNKMSMKSNEDLIRYARLNNLSN
jgi:two-component system, NarL family, invasion response regulator UvrY